MSDSSRALLRQLLIGGYGELKTRLAMRLGSADLANEALHDTWLKLETAAPSGPVHHPQSYLLRIAYNIALKQKKRARKTISLDDATKGLDLADDTPDQLEIFEGHAEIELLKEAASELTERQRDILFASRLEGVPLAELAVRHNVSQRWIELELRHAVFHCAGRVGRKAVQRFGPRPRQGSKSNETVE